MYEYDALSCLFSTVPWIWKYYSWNCICQLEIEFEIDMKSKKVFIVSSNINAIKKPYLEEMTRKRSHSNWVGIWPYNDVDSATFGSLFVPCNWENFRAIANSLVFFLLTCVASFLLCTCFVLLWMSFTQIRTQSLGVSRFFLSFFSI